MKDKSNTHRKWLVTVASGAMMMSVAHAAQAQVDEAEDEVIATGIRQSIEASIATKKDATSIVEAISSEDIGKLPDISIAESLSRLPGLAAQRVRGRAQVISVRGLGPDFTTALLNGREQVTAGDNRGVEFDQFPSELLSSALVYKTPDAALVGTGLAGTVDLRTIRPLDYKGDTTFTINARYEYNDLGDINAGTDADGYRLTGTYIGSNASETVGWMVGLATQSSPTQAERFNAWGYPTTGTGFDPADPFVIGGAKPYAESRKLERDSLVGTLQFEPTDALDITADAFYTKFKDGGVLRGIELPLWWSGAPLQPGYTTTDGIISSGVFANQTGIIRNDVRSREADLLSLGLNVGYQFNEKWSAELDISRSEITRDDRDLETYSGAAGPANVGFQLTGDGAFTFSSDQDYSDPSTVLLTDPGGWGQVGFIKEPQTDDELNAIRASVKRDFDDGAFSSVEVGANLTQRKKEKDSVESFLDLAGSPAGNAVAIPSDLLIGSTDLTFLGIGEVVSYDPDALLASGIYSLRANTNADVITKAWSVDEDVTTLYTKLDIDNEWGNIPVRGNVGVQFVHTEQSSTGPAVGAGGLALITDGTDYTDVLPSANFSFEVGEDTYLRVAAARTLARPRMEQLKASSGIGLNTQVCSVDANDVPTFNQAAYNLAQNQVCISGGGGNPQLEPIRANAIDLSFEKYFAGNEGYISVAFFHKDISDFIFDGITSESSTGSATFDFTSIANDIFGANFVAANPLIAQGILTRPQNAKGGNLRGIELATNIPGGHFADALEGFGVSASYSYTTSEVNRPGTFDPVEIPGLSKDVANVSVYYDNHGFQARVSNRYRSSFLGEIIGFGAGTETRTIDSESVVDGQIGYTFQDGPAEGLNIVLQGYNLTDEDFTTRFDNDLVQDYQRYGRTYLIGVGYKF